jgi:hypothetical protein
MFNKLLFIYIHSQRVIEQLENKMSGLREDLVTTKEALNRALLDKEILEGQKIEVGQYTARTLLIF